jgi:glucokinase
MLFLAGDIGGTKTSLALVEAGAIVRRKTYTSAQFPSLNALVGAFLDLRERRQTRACLGIAGPVIDDVCRATNLPWVIEARALERELRLRQVKLVNDFHALAVGISELPSSDFQPLNDAPSDSRGPWVVIGAGTGLGQAVLVRGKSGLEVIASEGGHADFAPRTELEVELLRYLQLRHGHVSWERVVSGPGLVMLYEFLSSRSPSEKSPQVLEEIERSPDGAAATISRHALKGDDPLCARALDLFVSLYAAEAGNLALKVLAPGGVYVAGGIAPKILPKLIDGSFMKRFLDKGRMSTILERMPVKVVLNPDAGLLGAAAIATGMRAKARSRRRSVR